MSGFLEASQKTVDKYGLREIRTYLKKCVFLCAIQAVHSNAYSRVYVPGNFEVIFLDVPDAALQNEFAPDAAADIAPDQTLPQIKGPFGAVQQYECDFATSFDSTGVKGTKGVFEVLSNKFYGKGGKFDWASLDLDPSKANVVFDAFSFLVNKPILKAENVTLNYSLLLSRAVKGDFEFVSKARKNIYYAKYPRFTSYSNDVEINQFVKS